MLNFAIVISIVAGIVLLMGIVLCIKGSNHLMWKKLYRQQKQLIETQRSVINNQRETIQSYKDMMAKGICIIPDERKN